MIGLIVYLTVGVFVGVAGVRLFLKADPMPDDTGEDQALIGLLFLVFVVAWPLVLAGRLGHLLLRTLGQFVTGESEEGGPR